MPGTNNPRFFECLLAATAAATSAFIFGLITGIGWRIYLTVMVAAAVLVGGILFTMLKMYHPGLSASDQRLAKYYETIQID